METVLRLQLKSLVPDLVPQVTITGEGAAFKTAREAKASGHRIVTRADFASLAWRLAFYYDGNHHSGEAQWRKDVHISTKLASVGWTVLRFTAEHLKANREVERLVRAVLRERGLVG